MRQRITCKCGQQITANTWKCHIKNKCASDAEWKDRVLSVLDIKSKKGRAWLLADGLDATAKTDWFISVINEDTQLHDWSFITPRLHGANTPKQRAKISKDRSGSKNPGVIGKVPNYDPEKIKDFAVNTLEAVLASDLSVSHVLKLMSREFPNIWYQFADFQYTYLKRGANKQNAILADILGISLDDLLLMYRKQRGKKIRIGQLASPSFREKASKHASGLLSKWRVTKPQLRLFNIIKMFDQDASLEKKIKDYSGAYRSYDIYSPKISALIEMHGRVWHDLSKTKPKLINIVLKNKENDIKKMQLAHNLGMKYLVFWDDQEKDWLNMVEKFYEKA